MFKFLQSKKGFTLVELLIVLALLGLGAVAFVNFFTVAMKSFNKSEERYIKQEAVKEVATLLQSGSENVAAAQSADIFKNSSVVPTGTYTDTAYSYLYAKESEDGEGYFIYVQNRNVKQENAKKLSETPIYIEIEQIVESKSKLDDDEKVIDTYLEPYNGVTIRLAALEDDYDYTSTESPIGDDIYYSLDVAYHFPNMATSDEYAMVNRFTKNEYATATVYGTKTEDDGSESVIHNGIMEAVHCDDPNCPVCPECKNDSEKRCDKTVCACPNKRGLVLRVYCDSIISADNTESAVSVPSMCFVATASYGLDSGEVGQLCEFRDKTLMNSELGKAFVKAYYEISPPIADAIRDSEPLKAVVRTALKPLIIVAEYANNQEIRADGAISFAIFMLCGITGSAIAVKMNQDKRRKRRQTVSEK